MLALIRQFKALKAVLMASSITRWHVLRAAFLLQLVSTYLLSKLASTHKL
jgi:hypothetical protein